MLLMLLLLLMLWLHVKYNIEIISVFYFTCYHVWNWNKIISADHEVLKLFQIILATSNMLENIHDPQ